MTSPASRPTLTAGITATGDPGVVRASVRALADQHRDGSGRLEIMVVGQLPARDVAALTSLRSGGPAVRFVAADADGTALRDSVVREADSDWVICMTPQARLDPGALAALREFADADPDCPDLLQGPLEAAAGGPAITSWRPVWRDGTFGCPAPESTAGLPGSVSPFEITMHDLGLFACRKDAWLGLNPRLSGSAAHEGYLHKKYRAAGRRTLCLPSLRWTRQPAAGLPQENTEDRRAALAGRLRDYLTAFAELGLGPEPAVAHFTGILGPAQVDEVRAGWEREQANPFTAFDAVVCLNLDSRPDRWRQMQRRFAGLGIAGRVTRIPAVPTAWNHHVGCALSHRRAIEYASRRGLDNVLVFEDDTVFLQGAPWVLRRSVRELSRRPWNLYYLGGYHQWMGDARPFRLAPGCSHLEQASGIICAHAIAYNQRIYGRLLTELPADEHAMADWISRNGNIDNYYADRVTDDVYRCVPVTASQQGFVDLELPDLRDQFLIDSEPGAAVRPGNHPASAPKPDPARAQPPASASPSADDPRLADLRRRYAAVDLPMRPLSMRRADSIHPWGRESLTLKEIPYQRFRSPSPLFDPEPERTSAVSGLFSAEVTAAALRAYADYIIRIDDGRLLDLLEEDGAFGCETFRHRDRRLSRDVLDSASELLFLHREGVLDQPRGLSVLEIGAGYGRLAYRMAQAVPGLRRYACVDAVPESTYLSEFYLAYRGLLPGVAEVVPLDELGRIRDDRFDLAIAITSLTEMPYQAVTGWLDLLAGMAVPALLIVPDHAHYLYSQDSGWRRTRDFAAYLRASGYHLTRDEPMIPDPAAWRPAAREHFMLFRRLRHRHARPRTRVVPVTPPEPPTPRQRLRRQGHVAVTDAIDIAGAPAEPGRQPAGRRTLAPGAHSPIAFLSVLTTFSSSYRF